MNEYNIENFSSLPFETQYKMIKDLNDPIVFSEKLLGLSLFEYQKKILADERIRLHIRKGRQIGMSFILALKSIFQTIRKPGSVVAIVSPSQRQSSLVFRYIMNFFKGHELLKPEIESKNSRCSQTVIELPNESIIYSLPCGNDGHTIRGISVPKGSILIVDEAAFIPEKAWEAVDYFTAMGGQEILSSTPLGKSGRFYEVSENPEYQHYVIPTTENPLIDRNWIKSREHLKSYASEILAEFISGEGKFFEETIIRACINAELNWNDDPRDVAGSFKCMGIDVSLERDPCVVTIARKKAEKFIPFFIRAYRKKNDRATYECEYQGVASYDEIEQEILIQNRRYGGINYAAVDATYNPYLAERLAKSMTVFPVKFNSTAKNGNPMKSELMHTLLAAMSGKKVELPNHPTLIRQLINYEFFYTENKNIKFSSSDEDFIDSLALCLYNELEIKEADNFAVV
ncbi:MAG: terminase family protein [Patescibacteria group bacterium]|nr:terminase family protein [Patescibacteria group bacterium]